METRPTDGQSPPRPRNQGGTRTLWSLESNRQRLDGGAMFGSVPRALWSRWVEPDERHRIPLATRCLLIEERPPATAAGGSSGGEPVRRILLETGIGAFFEPRLRARFGVGEAEHRLLAELGSLGLSDADIDVVVLSHLHFDHAGGLLTPWREGAEPALLFPRARFVVGATAWERALTPHLRDRASFIPAIQRLLSESGRLEIVDGEASATLGPEYRLHRSDGHTPGQLLTEVPGGPAGAEGAPGGPLVFAGDLVPGRWWVHLPVTMGYDRAAELLIDEKAALLGDLAARGGQLFFTHDPDIAAARVTLDARGRFGTTDHRARLRGEAATPGDAGRATQGAPAPGRPTITGEAR